jgi:tRNA A-37 threonylcarbamoyl transferase component Bud32
LAPHFPHLEILSLLGQGGMGAVYKARQVKLDRLVALKILPAEWGRDPAFSERFAREARALARLNHPHIVSVHDFGEAGGHFFLLMEFVDGANVRQLLQAGPLEPALALSVIPQICDALQYAHEEGVVHRDVKPENILVDKRSRVKIADFGLAKLVGTSRASFTLTGTHQVMGTVDYMAPEQRNRPQEVDHRADIYSLGVVFYEMLTGELPLGRFAPPSQVAAVDGRLDEVVFRSLEREPERRYQHASDIKSELDSIAGAAPAGGAPAGVPPHAGPYAAERVQLLVKAPAVMLFLSALAGLLFWIAMGVGYTIGYFQRHPDSRPPLWELLLLLGGGAAALLALAGTMLAGARKLLRFEGYEIVVAALVLEFLPWSPHAVIGMLAAVLSFQVLNRPEVTAAFAANLRRKQRRPGTSRLTGAGVEPRRPTGPWRQGVRSFLRSLRSAFVGRTEPGKDNHPLPLTGPEDPG